jgi:hypothetical protein
VETDYDIERFIFVQVKNRQGGQVTEQELFAMGRQRLPVLMVDVDSHSREVLSVVRISDSHKWGKIAMPIF